MVIGPSNISQVSSYLLSQGYLRRGHFNKNFSHSRADRLQSLVSGSAGPCRHATGHRGILLFFNKYASNWLPSCSLVSTEQARVFLPHPPSRPLPPKPSLPQALIPRPLPPILPLPRAPCPRPPLPGTPQPQTSLLFKPIWGTMASPPHNRFWPWSDIRSQVGFSWSDPT